MTRRVVARAVAGLFLAAASAIGAPPPGALVGRVTDEAGQALPGVTVEAEGPGLPSARRAVSDGTGGYRLEDLPGGLYRVAFALEGFVGASRERVAVQPGETSRVDAALRLSVSADVLVTGRRSLRDLPGAAGPGESLVGIADSATQGTVTARQIESRPAARPGDVLESVPGLVISQHSGEGKANQYYLRGFDLDHGTDFSTTVAGMPINMPSHAHGQGYTDVSFVIPELVGGIEYRKGPYSVEDGDFAAAGSASIRYREGLDEAIARVDGGSFGYLRGLVAASPAVGEGRLLYAVEGTYDDGPWVRGDHYRKLNGVLRYGLGEPGNGLAITAMGYQGAWDSTDQIPRRAVAEGEISRFGEVDSSDGGQTHRYSLSAEYRRSGDASATRAVAYGIAYGLDLWSNFTYFRDHPDTGDQFQQTDRRRIYGGELTHRWLARMLGVDGENEVGLEGRFDDVGKVALYHTEDRRVLSTTREDSVRQASGAVFFQNDTPWTSRFRTVVGVRGDLYRFDVAGIGDPLDGGKVTRGIFSPKLSLIFGPFGQSEVYANAGYGFHSNDARAATIPRDPPTGERQAPVTPLVRAKAAELGVRSLPLPGWQTTFAFWALDVASELVYVGDAGTTEASRPSRRYGVEWSNAYRVLPWLRLDADLSLSRARFRGGDPAAAFVPGAVETVAAAGVSADSLGPFSGSLRLRYVGPRPLSDDGRVRSGSATAVNVRLGYELMRGLKAQLDVFNVLDAKTSEVDYFYTSRLPGEPAGGVEDVHFHPATPRSARASLIVGF